MDEDTKKRLAVGIIGLGGFAGSHHAAVRSLEDEGTHRLVCTCDPNRGDFAGTAARLDFPDRGVRLYDDHRAMLDAHARELDIVVIPTPIHLHAAMHADCVRAGVAVYLEKPPTLHCAELAEMLAVEAQARLATLVGFLYIVEEPRRRLKERILSGEFGRVLEVRLTARWPRSTAYFSRAPWAGKISLDGAPVLDSCMGNAISHYVHNILFWAGTQGIFSWAEPVSVEAAVHRAHGIESADTFFVRARLDGGAALRVALTHACTADEGFQEERVVCERGEIVCVAGRTLVVRRPGAPGETVAGYPVPDLLAENHRAYGGFVRGEVPRPMTRLADAGPFVRLYDLAFLAAGGISGMPAEAVRRSPAPDGGEFVSVAGLPAAMDRFAATGELPAEQGLAWGGGCARAVPADLQRFPALFDSMRRAAVTRPARS